MLRIIWGIALIAAISGLGHFLLNYMRRAPKKSKRGCARVRALYPIVGTICAVFFGGVICAMFASHRSRLNYGLLPGFGVICIGGVVMVWQWISERIWYNKTSFVVRNFWMVKKKYDYKDITGIFIGAQVYIIVGRTKIAISSAIEGGERFLRTAQKGYAEANNGADIPRARTLPRDVFNGNVDDSSEYIMVALLLLSFLGGTLLYINLPPSKVTSDYFEAPMENGSAGAVDLNFYLQTQEEPFVIKDFRKYAQNIDQFWSTADKSIKLSVYAEYMAASRSRSAYYHVCSLSDENGTEYVTFDMTRQQEREWRKTGVILIGGFLAVMVLYGTACVVAARNPEKHKRLYRLCFSQNYKREKK